MVGSGFAARVQRVSADPLVDASFSSQVAACPVRESLDFINTVRARSAINVVETDAVADSSIGRSLGIPEGSLPAQSASDGGLDHPPSALTGPAARISDAERHTSDVPIVGAGGSAFSGFERAPAGAMAPLRRAEGANAEIGPRQQDAMVQVPRINPIGGMGALLETRVRGPLFTDLMDALKFEAPAVDGLYVRFFRKCSLFGLNPVRKTDHAWRSMSVRGGGRTKGVMSFWRGDSGHNMVAYRDGDAVLAWFDKFRTAMEPEDWARLMHAMNGNIVRANRYAVLAGTDAETAAEIADQLLEREDVEVDGEDWDACEVQEVDEDPDYGERLKPSVHDDEEVCAVLDIIGRTFVKAYKGFNVQGDPVSAKRWNDMHAMVESSKVDVGLRLGSGVRFKTVMQPATDKKTQGTKKKKEVKTRSPNMQARDAARLSAWLGEMNPECAEGWVRANKPPATHVPASTPYLDAYSRRATIGEYYKGATSEDTIGCIDMFLADASKDKAAYLGPKSRALIQSLLMIGGIEMHPGPSIPVAAANNYGMGAGYKHYCEAAVNYVMTLERPNTALALHTAFGCDAGRLNPLVQAAVVVAPIPVAVAPPPAILPAVVAPVAPAALGPPAILPAVPAVVAPAAVDTLAFCTDQSVACDYYATIGFVDATHRSSIAYDRVWVGGEWVVEAEDDDGSVLTLTPKEITDDMRLLAKLSHKTATGEVDLSKPILYIFDTRATRQHYVWPHKVQVARALGLTYHAFIGPTMARVHVEQTGELIMCDRKVLNQVLRTFGRNVLSGTCTSNIQSLLTAGSVDLSGSEMAHLTNFSYYSTLQAAQISALTVSPYRDALLVQARTGRPSGGWIAHFFGWVPQEPDYRNVYGTVRPHWFVEMAGKTTFYLTLFAGGCYVGYRGLSLTSGVIGDKVGQAADAVSALTAGITPGQMPTVRPSSWFSPGTYYNTQLWKAEVEAARLARVATGSDSTYVGQVVGKCKNFVYSVDRQLAWLWRSSGTSCSIVPHWSSQFVEEAVFSCVPGARFVVALAEMRTKSLVEGVLGLGSHLSFYMAGPLALPAHLVSNALVTKRRVFFFNSGMGFLSQYIKRYKGVPLTPEAALMVTDHLRHAGSKAARVFQLGPSILDMSSFAVNQGNKLLSCVGRVCKVTPSITNKGLFKEITGLMDEFGRDVRAAGGVEEVPWEEFIARFAPGKREIYEESRRKWEALGPDVFFGALVDRREIMRQNFLKHELNPFKLDDQFGVPISQPRTISPISYIMQGLFGGWLLGFGAKIKQVLSYKMYRNTKLILVSGYTVEEMSAMLLKELTPANDVVVCCGDDALFSMAGKIWYVDGKRWDAHYRNEYHHAKIHMYQQAGMSELYARLMYFFLRRVMTWKQGVGCIILKNVTSGDPDTTLGNGTTNGAVIICCKEGCTTWEEFAARTQSVGFTYVAAASHQDLQPRGDFCSRTWVESHTPEGEPTSQLVLKPGKGMGKGGWTANGSTDPDELLDAKLTNLAIDLACFPELSEIIRSARLRMTRRSLVQVIGEEWNHYVATGGLRPVDGHRFFAERYNVEYSEVVRELKLWVEALNGDDWEIELPTLRRVCEVDFEVTSFHGPLGDDTLDLVPQQAYMSEARQSRWEYVWLKIKLRANKLMHSLVGNGMVQQPLAEVGGRGAQTYQGCREVPRYHRTIEDAAKGEKRRQEEGGIQQSKEEAKSQRVGRIRYGRTGEVVGGGGRSALGVKDTERYVRKARRSHWTWLVPLFGFWRLCYERHCAQTGGAEDRGGIAGGVELRVHQGHHGARRAGVFSAGLAGQRGGDYVSVDADNRPAVHEVPIQAAFVRIPLYEQRLFVERRSRVRHHGAFVQYQSGRFFHKTTNGSRHTRCVIQAKQFMCLWNRMRRSRQQCQVVQCAHGGSGVDPVHRSAQILLRSGRLSCTHWHRLGRAVGSLHCRVDRADFECSVHFAHHECGGGAHHFDHGWHRRYQLWRSWHRVCGHEFDSSVSADEVRDYDHSWEATQLHGLSGGSGHNAEDAVVRITWRVPADVERRIDNGTDGYDHREQFLHGFRGRGLAVDRDSGAAGVVHGVRQEGVDAELVCLCVSQEFQRQLCLQLHNGRADCGVNREYDERVVSDGV